MDGGVTVETDITDIGTGTYTIIAQTAAEMMAARSGDKFALAIRLFQFPPAPVVSGAPTT
jgi:xanthine dehydrogenase YagR molybdenum-binding subunit